MTILLLFSACRSFSKTTTTTTIVRAASINDILQNRNKPSYRVIQVHLVHRHGDRSPITPMKDPSYWSSELIPKTLLQKMDATTQILRHRQREEEEDNNNNTQQHLAAGRGPFGQLTQLGLLQMVKLGTTIREQLLQEDDDGEDGTSSKQQQQQKEKDRDDNNNNKNEYSIEQLFHTTKNPLLPSKVQVWSTDFPRTIQSVQGTLMGLFPDETNNNATPINVDARHTSIMIPDPQPRNSQEQTDLETILSQRPNILEKEREHQALKEDVTSKLLPFVNEEEAFGISFGIGEEGKHSSQQQKKSLSLIQLSEIMNCLRGRNLLPEDIKITPKMQQTITEFCAWKWFSILRNDRMAYLAMHPFCDTIVQTMQQQCCGEITKKENEATTATKKQLHLYSAHDSSLIGLLCAFHLEKPAKWPEYGSYFKAELLQRTTTEDDENRDDDELLVRFSLNNQILKSEWGNANDEMISLDQLAYHVATSGASSPSSST